MHHETLTGNHVKNDERLSAQTHADRPEKTTRRDAVIFFQKTIGNRAFARLLQSQRDSTRPIVQKEKALEKGYQIKAKSRKNRISRAETEDSPSVCGGLTDIASEVNDFVNRVLTAARSTPGVAPFPPFFDAVRIRTGGNGAISPIETYIDTLPTTKRFTPPSNLSGTRFSGLPSATGLGIPGLRSILGTSLVPDINIYHAQGVNIPGFGSLHVVGSSVKINGICVGSDKLGHFFQQGAQYYGEKLRSGLTGRAGQAVAESFGRGTEIGRAGLGATGVYSNADLAANLDGLRFWEDLEATPSMTFDIATYINQNWNEYTNPNFYESSVARVVWPTQLSGNWEGDIGRGALYSPGPSSSTGGPLSQIQNVSVNLSSTGSGIMGTFSYPYPSPTTGTLIGTITYNTTPVSGSITSGVLHGSAGAYSASPVSSVTIQFDWRDGTNSGKGVWNSHGEHQLFGTYGTGTSTTNQGVFNIHKV